MDHANLACMLVAGNDSSQQAVTGGLHGTLY